MHDSASRGRTTGRVPLDEGDGHRALTGTARRAATSHVMLMMEAAGIEPASVAAPAKHLQA